MSVSSLWRRPALILLLFVLGLAFTVYCAYRQEYVGGVDWYGYYQQAQLLKSGRIHLPVDLPVAAYPAAVPLGFFPAGDLAVPQYPPGFPVLLALAGFLNLEYFVTPLVGLLTCLFIFLIIRDLTDEWTAVIFTFLWSLLPIVVYGSTTIMSDLVATLGLLISYYAYRRGRLFLSALVLGLSFTVRPTNALYLLAFALPLLRDRHLIRYGLYLVLPGVLYAIYNQAVYGAPWRTGYSDLNYDLTSDFFSSHLLFYLQETLRQFTLPLLLLGLFGLNRPRAEKSFYLVWFGLFLGFYCFWRSGGDRWWWTRFLLPGYAPLFFISAIGFARIRHWLALKFKSPRAQVRVHAVLLGVLVLLPFHYISYGENAHDLWLKHRGSEYAEVARHIESLAPPGSYVGSVEFGGALRIYTKLASFVSLHENSPALVETVLRDHRRAYLILEPWNQDHPVILELFARFPTTRLPNIKIWDGVQVYELHLPPAKT